MSRLGGAGAVASTASDHPAEVLTTFCQECNCYYVAMCISPQSEVQSTWCELCVVRDTMYK
jgi:hypothetical protein